MNFRRWWCRLVHSNARNVRWCGGPTYTCRRCLTKWKVPWAIGPNKISHV
jgi:hypothetical protein